MFNYIYLLRIRNRLEENVRKSFGSKILAATLVPEASSAESESNVDMFDDDMSRLQDIAPDNYMDHRRYLPQQERDTFQFPIQRDHSEWLNPYAQGDRDSYEDIRRERLEEFLQYASTNDAYW